MNGQNLSLISAVIFEACIVTWESKYVFIKAKSGEKIQLKVPTSNFKYNPQK